jgi:hypothetical protein
MYVANCLAVMILASSFWKPALDDKSAEEIECE